MAGQTKKKRIKWRWRNHFKNKSLTGKGKGILEKYFWRIQVAVVLLKSLPSFVVKKFGRNCLRFKLSGKWIPGAFDFDKNPIIPHTPWPLCHAVACRRATALKNNLQRKVLHPFALNFLFFIPKRTCLPPTKFRFFVLMKFVLVSLVLLLRDFCGKIEKFTT